jgi:single-strand DNA-binding protein
MYLPTVAAEFRAVADAELRFAPSGVAVAKVRAVASKQKKNDAGEWVDDKDCWVSVVAFKRLAENMAESILKGDLFVVVGKINTEDWEDKDGNKRTSINVVADHIGPSLTFNPAIPQRTERASGGGGGGSKASSQDGDPWAAPDPAGNKTEDPPF